MHRAFRNFGQGSFSFSALMLACSSYAQATYKGHTYQLTHAAQDWNMAQAEALSQGGYLACVNDAAEQTFLNTTFLAPRQPFWIGLNDIGHKGSYSKWINGDSVIFTNWKGGEPNNSGGNEDYVAVNWEYSRSTGPQGTWNDAPLGGTKGYQPNTDGPYFGIIERPAAVPEPGLTLSFALMGAGATGCLLRRRRRRNQA